MDSRSRLTPGNVIILTAGIVMLAGSFLAFYKASEAVKVIIGHDQSWNAWSPARDHLLFPVSTLVVLFGVAMAAHIVLTAFSSVDLPDCPFGFTWDQVHLVLAFNATVLMLAYLIRDSNDDRGIGFWLLLLSSIALLGGAILRRIEARPPAPRRRR
jgi:hypothetical protein